MVVLALLALLADILFGEGQDVVAGAP